ncbi:MAG TPA: CGNR zinc finger domain-containing protein [Candidatus Acidoferrum sp.]|jgi:predicted RNA-binding Zn ribbon-like protein
MTTASNQFFSRGFGALAPWIDLVNSGLFDGFGNPTECLDDPLWVRTFLNYWKLRASFREPEAQKALRALRSLLCRLVEKNSSHGSLGPQDVAELNGWLKVPVYPALVENQNGFELSLQSAQKDWRGDLAKVARSFAESLIREPSGRLKICRNADCRWVFIDRTKGNVRRWCNDATCGNRDRVRRSRAARRKKSPLQ